MTNSRNSERKTFAYYMAATNNRTDKILGHLSDISATGIRLDCSDPIPPNMDFEIRLELTPDVSFSPFMTFVARSRWCKQDEITPNLFNAGFEIVQMGNSEREIFQRIIDRYAS